MDYLRSVHRSCVDFLPNKINSLEWSHPAVANKHNGRLPNVTVKMKEYRNIGPPKEDLMKKLFAVLAMAIGMSSAAHAGILIEPYLGYETGDSMFKYVPSVDPSGTEFTDSITGASYGMRLGYQFMIPWVALDYSAGTQTAKADKGRDGYDLTKSSLGAVVGVSLPLVRAWAGYGFSNEMTKKGTAGNPDNKFKGTYLKAGVGLGILPLLELNLEYKINDLKKVDFGAGAGEQDKSDVFDSTKYDTIMFSISVPFNL
jgi:opacity protein-like surface antigen